MDAVLQGYNLDRDASGLNGVTDVDMQAKLMAWTADPPSAPECTFYK